MRRVLLLAGLVLAVAAPADALAANQTVNGLDGTTGLWSPENVSVHVGDTVTWSFASTTQAHNVAANSANWTLTSPIQVAHPDVTYTFTTAGTYAFVCQVHPDTMKGTVSVDTTPPPPPPLSEQPFPNDQTPPAVLEITDEQRPALSRVRAAAIAHGARIRFRTSEPGRVTVRVEHGKRTVATRTVRVRRAGTKSLRVRGLRAGTYRIEVLARDLAGNRSRVKRAVVTVH
jgi:plastocyanin